jgi:uncharacterized protein (DUF2141 family)
MNNRIFSLIFQYTAFAVIICSCAKISAPTGGPRDKKPPVVIKNVPVNRTKNFREKSMEITFDEYVVLDNINDKFMVSPPMKKKPRVYIKGKSVNVEFNEDLKDSTTYTFYFQDAIRDLNEGNILDNFQLVFSTGAVIDSLSVTGNVYNSMNLEVPEKILVLMYSELADSAVEKHLPDYISRADQEGYFRIDNIRAGTYKLYALKDEDNSKNFNLPDEEFAFLGSPVEVTAEKSFIPVIKDTVKVMKGLKMISPPVTLKSEYQLILFAGPGKNHYLTSSNRALKYQMVYTLSLPPDSMKFGFSIPGASSNSFLLERSRNRDTLKVWLKDSTLYSQPQITTIVNYPFTDTLGITGYKEDTILMRFLTPRAPRVAKVRKPVFSFVTNISSGNLKPGNKIMLKAETPFLKPDTSRIHLYEIANSKRKEIPLDLIPDSTNSCKYSINSNLAPGKNYLFIADSASFGNIYKEYSDSTGIKFLIKEPESYSKLTLNIFNYEGNRIIQLLDKNEKLVSEKQMKKDGELLFSLLESGIYRIRVIYDLNGDGKWTTGDFTLGRQPEPVSYYPNEIDIKPGWDIEKQDWDIGVTNFKDGKLRAKAKTR